MPHDIKRYAMIALTCAAFSVAGWQIIDMLSDNSATIATPRQAHKTTHFPKHHRVTHAQTKKVVATDFQAATTSTTTSPYVRLAKEIELAKLQNKLIEQKVAIAAGQEKLRNSTVSAQTDITGNSTANSRQYHLVFAMRKPNGKWQAVIARAGQKLEVHIGSSLLGNYTVTSITTNTVTLSHATHPLLVNFDGQKRVGA